VRPLIRRAKSAVTRQHRQQNHKISGIWLPTVSPVSCAGSICPDRRRRQWPWNRGGYSLKSVAVYDLETICHPSVEFHRHQIVGEIARRQLASHLDEGGLEIVGAGRW